MQSKLATVMMMLLVALVDFGAAQKDSEQKITAPAEIAGFEWKYQGYASAEMLRSESRGANTRAKRGMVYVFKYTAKVSLKNQATKTIKAVEWNYVFLDPQSEKELKRYKIQSKQQIAPLATQTLAKDIFLDLKDDTSHLKNGKQKISIARIEYTDGSSWRP